MTEAINGFVEALGTFFRTISSDVDISEVSQKTELVLKKDHLGTLVVLSSLLEKLQDVLTYFGENKIAQKIEIEDTDCMTEHIPRLNVKTMEQTCSTRVLDHSLVQIRADKAEDVLTCFGENQIAQKLKTKDTDCMTSTVVSVNTMEQPSTSRVLDQSLVQIRADKAEMNPDHVVKRRRLYDADHLMFALKAVLEDGHSIRSAARLHNVPFTTLGDRVKGRVAIDCTRPGPAPVLSPLEEQELVEHMMHMSAIGYGYTRSDVMSIAGEYLSSMERREPSTPLSDKWFYNFIKRWPELTVMKHSELEVIRARSTNPQIIASYYTELHHILEKYKLTDKPEYLYHIEEKAIDSEHKPCNVVGGRKSKAQTLASPTASTTVIASANANGKSIPPYFVFKGARFLPELLNNSITGSDGTVSATGCSNSKIIKSYLDHFAKHSQGEGTKLILFNGRKTYVNPDTIAWAKSHDIILFVLPPHTSWILEPLDVACFDPFSCQYGYEEKKFMSEHPGQVVSRYNVAEIASKAYSVGLSTSNLKSAFKKCGIFPFDANAWSLLKFSS